MYKAYLSGLCKGIPPENMVLYGTNVPPFLDPEISIDLYYLYIFDNHTPTTQNNHPTPYLGISYLATPLP